jgi:colicin import membrane protein
MIPDAMFKSSPSLKSQPVRDSSYPLIVVLVLFLHVLGIWILFFTNPKQTSPPRSKVVVKTIQLQPRSTLSAPSKPLASAIPQPAKELPIPAASLPEPVKEAHKETETKKMPEKEEPTKPTKPVKPKAPQPQEKPAEKKELAIPKKVENQADPAPKKTPAAPKPTPQKKPAAAPKTTPAPVQKTTANEPKKPAKEAKKESPPPPPPKPAVKEPPKPSAEELAAKAKEQELLAKAKESIAKIGQTRDKLIASKGSEFKQTELPKQLDGLHIDALPMDSGAELTSKEINYRDEVAYHLKLSLRLPDYGEVKLKLTLERSGKVSKVQIVSSESQKNKQYIEKAISSLTFPPFGNNFENLSHYTFLIKLNNDL